MSGDAPKSSAESPDTSITRIALVGNPNTGKTTLFSRLCGVRVETANFPGTTADARIGTRVDGDDRYEIVDLPGHYGLNLDRPESRLCRDYLNGELPRTPAPDVVVIVVDGTNLARNLIFACQALQQGLPAVVVVNMIDLAQRRGLSLDLDVLSARLDCPVVALNARSGAGMPELADAMRTPRLSRADFPPLDDASAASDWSEAIAVEVAGAEHLSHEATDHLTERLDGIFTHPVLGIVAFAAVMIGLFYVIFTLATIPMDLIDLLFTHLGNWATAIIPDGAIQDLVVNGIVAGIAGTVVFLPQICLLFFLISLLEDTGYLARAVFVMDRMLRRFGLPGQAFVPLLSAHACAIPAIMAARLIPDHRDRLATILVAPFMSCSARLPVYVLLISMLFVDKPLLAGLAFTGCYALGAIAALLTALIARRSILRGPSRPMVLELPSYKMPSLRSALLTTYDRGLDFIKNAGTVILAVCIVLWWLGSYPHVDAPAEVTQLREQVATMQDTAAAESLTLEADTLEARHAKEHSFIGRAGRIVEPVFEPLGYDWQLSVGVLSSFLAREVFVSTMAVIIAGTEDDPAEDSALRDRIVNASRSDGTPLFNRPAAASLLIFYVFAMQCLPTLVVTRRETGNWWWALLQLGYMTGLAYVLAFATYRLMLAFG